MPVKTLLNPAYFDLRGNNRLLSGRQAADYLELAHKTFFDIAHVDLIMAHKKRRENNKWIGEYLITYLAEVKKVLPPERGHGIVYLTDDVLKGLKTLNKAWFEKEDLDWKQEYELASKFIKELRDKRKRKK